MTTDGGAGRALPPTSAFAGDDGAAPADLAAALTLDDPQARLEAVVEELRNVRVLVPVVARLDEMPEVDEHSAHGIAGGKSAHAAMVTVGVPDGRAALPVFSSITALQQWRVDARPIPVEGRRAALAAGSEADGVLVLDPGSTAPVQIPRPAVRAIALGEPWIPAVRHHELGQAVNDLLTRVPGVAGARVLPGTATEVQIVVHVRWQSGSTMDQETAAVLRACQHALAGSQQVVDLVDSVTVIPAITR